MMRTSSESAEQKYLTLSDYDEIRVVMKRVTNGIAYTMRQCPSLPDAVRAMRGAARAINALADEIENKGNQLEMEGL